MNFNDLNLNSNILKAVAAEGYETPTPIQQKAIPLVMEGKDIRASADTGTGKTAAFILPALDMLQKASKMPGKGPRILVLVPTRELAMQVAHQAAKYSKFLPKVKTVCIYGGAPYPIQNRELSRPYDILVATPGRLIDHLERGRIDFSRIELFILDEADRMLDMGFIEPVEQIAAELPEEHQTLLFSATLKGPVLKLSQRLMNDPVELAIAPKKDNVENIEQRLHHVDSLSHKHQLLEHLLTDEGMNQAIIFTSTKRNADELTEMLLDLGHEVSALHGDMNQRQRTRTMSMLRSGKIKVLIATDVAARGIDVQTITHVINFDLPRNVEDYVHRIGRTGRAGAQGVATSFASHKDQEIVGRIEKYTGKKMTPHVIPGLEPKFKPKATRGAPERRDSFRGRGPSRGSSFREDSRGGSSRGGFHARGESSGRDSSARETHREAYSRESHPKEARESFNHAPRNESVRGDREERARAPRENFSHAPRSHAPRTEGARGEGARGDSRRSHSRSDAPRSGESRFAPRGESRGAPRGESKGGFRGKREESRPRSFKPRER